MEQLKSDNLIDVSDEYKGFDISGLVDVTDKYKQPTLPANLIDVSSEYKEPISPKQAPPSAVHTPKEGIVKPLTADMEAYRKAFGEGADIKTSTTPPPDIKNVAAVYAGQPPTGIKKLTIKDITGSAVNIGKNIIGAGEMAANVLTGIPGFFVDAGIATGAGYGTLLRGGSIDEAAQNITGMQDFVRPYVVYQPKTEEGSKAVNNLQKVLDFSIGTPTHILGEYTEKGVSTITNPTVGAAAGAGIKTLSELAAYMVLFNGLEEGVKQLRGIKEPIKTRPLTDKDVIDFNNFIEEEAVRLKGKNLNVDDILEALRGKEASQAAYDYIKILPVKERANLARSILTGKKIQVEPQTEVINRGGVLSAGKEGKNETQPAPSQTIDELVGKLERNEPLTSEERQTLSEEIKKGGTIYEEQGRKGEQEGIPPGLQKGIQGNTDVQKGYEKGSEGGAGFLSQPKEVSVSDEIKAQPDLIDKRVPELPSIDHLVDEQVSPNNRTLYRADKQTALDIISKTTESIPNGGKLYRAIFSGDKEITPGQLTPNPNNLHKSHNGVDVAASWWTTNYDDALQIAKSKQLSGKGDVEIVSMDASDLPSNVYVQNLDHSGYLDTVWFGIPDAISLNKLTTLEKGGRIIPKGGSYEVNSLDNMGKLERTDNNQIAIRDEGSGGSGDYRGGASDNAGKRGIPVPQSEGEGRDNEGLYQNTSDTISKPVTPLTPQEFTEKIKGKPLNLTPSERQTLSIIRKEVEAGEAGSRMPVRDDEGYRTGQTISVPSTLPEYFQNQGYTKKETLAVIDKALADKPLTQRQQGIIDNLQTVFREKTAKEVKSMRASKEVSAWDLNEGDAFKRKGEEFKVIDKDTSGFLPEVTLKDGEEITLKGDETIKVDRGTLEKGKAKGETALTLDRIPKDLTVNVAFIDNPEKTERINARQAFTENKENIAKYLKLLDCLRS